LSITFSVAFNELISSIEKIIAGIDTSTAKIIMILFIDSLNILNFAGKKIYKKQCEVKSGINYIQD
jgi:hypothetical protein